MVRQVLKAVSTIPGGQVRILDLMGGVGVGGISLSLALKEVRLNPDLTVLNIRAVALEKVVSNFLIFQDILNTL